MADSSYQGIFFTDRRPCSNNCGCLYRYVPLATSSGIYFFSYTKSAPATSQPAVFFFHSKSAPATSHNQPNRAISGMQTTPLRFCLEVQVLKFSTFPI
jgi:hypothetical protein